MSKAKKPPVLSTAPKAGDAVEDLPIRDASDADVKGGSDLVNNSPGIALTSALEMESRKFSTLSNASQASHQESQTSIQNLKG